MSLKAIMLHLKQVCLSVHPSIHLCIAKELFCTYMCVCTLVILALYIIFVLSMPCEFCELDHILRLLTYLYSGSSIYRIFSPEVPTAHTPCHLVLHVPSLARAEQI